MITVKLLTKSYGEKQVLNDLNVSFEEQKTTCIMGESGCGKTTLLRILLGIEKQDSGEVTGLEQKKIVAVFQEDRLCNDFNAITNIKMVLDKAFTKEQIISHLNEVGLAIECLAKPMKQLSGGMKRRVAIVRSIIVESDVILMDEPLKGLDMTTKNMVVDYIKQHTKDKTLIIVTHQEEEVSCFNSALVKLSTN